MANNKVQLADGTTLIDLTSDTVTPQTMLAGTTAHAASGEQITGVVNLANASTAVPLANGIGAVGSSNNYAREDHVHPLAEMPFQVGTYNDSQAAIYNSYLAFVNAQMNELTYASAARYIPFFSSNYTDWPENVVGVATVYKLGNASRYFILAELINGHVYSNVRNGDTWSGWILLNNNSDDSSIAAMAKFNNGGTLTNLITGSTLERAIIKQAGPVVVVSAMLRNFSEILNGTAILTIPAAYKPQQNTVIFGNATINAPVSILHQRNLLDNVTTEADKGIRAATGVIAERSNMFVTDYIPIDGNTSYKRNIGSNSSTWGTCFYDETKTFISGVLDNTENLTFTTPLNAKYMKTCGSSSDLSSLTIQEIETIEMNRDVAVPILLSTDGNVYAYCSTVYPCSLISLAGSYGHFVT